MKAIQPGRPTTMQMTFAVTRYKYANTIHLTPSHEQGLTGRVFQLRVGYGSGIGKNISGRIGYGLGTGIGIKYRANRVLSGIEKT